MDVTGVDLTPAYLEQARADPQLPPGRVTYLEGDVRSLPVDGPFDAVVCWLNSFGYYDDADCHRVLGEFHRVLRPGGKVAIDTMHHDGGVRHFVPAPDAVVVQKGDDTMVEVSTFDPIRGRMVIQRTVHRDGAVRRASYFVRLPTPPEWVVWLEAAGFRDVEFHAVAVDRSSSTAGSWWWSPRPEGRAGGTVPAAGRTCAVRGGGAGREGFRGRRCES